MATELATAYVNILPSTKGLGKAVLAELDIAHKAAEPEASKSGKRLGSSMGGALKTGLGAAIGAAGGLAAILGVGALTEQIVDAVKKAGDFEQNVGAVDAVFKDGAGEIRQFGATAAKTLGMSQNQWLEFSTLLGASLKNGGTAMDELGEKTIGLGTLAADLSSMFGGTAMDVSEGLLASLRGEYDPLERYGISLSAAKIEAEAAAMGFEKVGDSFDDQAKQAATLSLIYKQTGDAQGNFARETDTFAGKVQILTASWADFKTRAGGLVLPGLTKVVGWITDSALPILEEGRWAADVFWGALTAKDLDDYDNGVLTGFPLLMENLAFFLRDAGHAASKILTPALSFLGGLLTDTIVPAVEKMADWLGRNKTVLEGISVMAAAAVAPWALYTGVMALYAGAVSLATSAVGKLSIALLWAQLKALGFSAAISANWIGIIVGAIAALVAGLIWFFTQTELGQAIWAKVWGSIKSITAGFLSWWTGSFWPGVQAVLGWLGEKFSWVGDVASGIWSAIVDAGSVLLDWITGLGSKFSWIGDVVALVWSGIKTATGVWLTVVRGYFTVLGTALSTLGDVFSWLYVNIVQPVWLGIRQAVAIPVGIIWALLKLFGAFLTAVFGPLFSWLYESVIKPAWAGIKSAISGVVAWFRDTAWPILRNAATWISDKFGWLWGKIKLSVEGWKIIISAVVGWFRDTAWPIVRGVATWIGEKFTWLWTKARDAFTWVRDKIAGFLGWFRDVLWPAVSAVVGLIAARFLWFYQDKIRPIFDWITSKIRVFSDWFRDNIWPSIRRVLDWLGEKFRWLYDSIVRPIWDKVADKLQTGWDRVRTKVFDPLVGFVKDTIPEAFKAARDLVGKYWDGIKAKISGPLKAAIEIVNDPFISSINEVMEVFQVPKDKHLKPLSTEGFAHGGHTGPGRKYQPAGIVHADEYVIRKESQRDVERTSPGFLDRLNRYGSAALGYARGGKVEGFDPTLAAMGAHVYGRPSFSGRNWEAIHRTGELLIDGDAPRWDMAGAIRMADAATSIKVRKGRGPGDNSIYVAERNYPVSWDGLYGEDGGILLNTARSMGWSTQSRRTIAAHEIGHALGLPHAMSWQGGDGSWSIMNYDNMLKHNSYTPTDVAALSAIYGGTGRSGGAGSGSGEDPGSGGWLSKIWEKVTGAFTKIPDLTAGPMFDIVKGLGSTLLDHGKSWVSQLNPFADESSTEARVVGWITKALKMKGMFSETHLQAGVARAMHESGGNPNAIQGEIGDINNITGNLARGLMQVVPTTFEAHKEPGHDDIFDPIDNILASINYTVKAWGTLSNGWGDLSRGYAGGGLVKPQLFDEGGLLHRGVQVIDHQRSSPDKILTDRQWKAVYSTSEAVRSGVADNGSTVLQPVFQVNDSADVDRVARRAAEMLVHQLPTF